jgi:hypothetical protein
MAMIQPVTEHDMPWWPDGVTPLADPPARYDRFADELVARFHDWSGTPVATSFLNAPELGYIGVIEELEGGRIVGIQIDNLELTGVRDHPHWRALLRPEPPRAAVAALVADVRALFHRYGVPPE